MLPFLICGKVVPVYIHTPKKKKLFTYSSIKQSPCGHDLIKPKLFAVAMRKSCTDLFRLRLLFILEQINKIILTGKYQSGSITEDGERINITYFPLIPYKRHEAGIYAGEENMSFTRVANTV